MEREPISLGERIVARILRRGDCWMWTGSYAADGYPIIELTSATYSIIPTLWEHVNGPVPVGAILVCTHTRAGSEYCVNPAHYQPRPAGRPLRRTCRHGHDLTVPDNVWMSEAGVQVCLVCNG
jgi:hypothetical protein